MATLEFLELRPIDKLEKDVFRMIRTNTVTFY